MSSFSKIYAICQHFVVKNIYGDHNKSAKVKAMLASTAPKESLRYGISVLAIVTILIWPLPSNIR